MNYLEDKRLLELRFSNGMMMLPFIRYKLLCSKNQGNVISSTEVPLSKIRIFYRLFSNLPHIGLKKKKLVFFSSTLFNIELENKKGTYYNSLDGYYYNLFPNDSLLIEDADDEFRWRTKNSYRAMSFIKTYLLSFSFSLSRILNKIKPIRRTDFGYILKNYPDLYTIEELGCLDYFHRIYYSLIKWLLKKIQCKCIAVNCGSYGETYAPFIKAAHDLGIRVIELQHGAITTDHLAYHADSYITQNKEFATYIPDCLCTFGEYWKQYVDWKYEIIPVGNPHLNRYIKQYADVKVINDFLVISQPAIREYILPFVKDLAAIYSNKKIVLRLHPRDGIDCYKEIIDKFPNISLSFSYTNLYKDISQAHYVIGGYSTCLFEAMAFHKKIIIIDAPIVRKYFPADIGFWVKSAAELNLIGMSNCNSVDSNNLWTNGFEERVKQMLNKYIE